MENSLQRFVDAQEDVYEVAYREMENGRKTSHWIWFIFPQIKGLGNSYNSNYYGIDSLEEAQAYLDSPVLSERLRGICHCLLTHQGEDIYDIMGHIDAVKLKSSMTLFDLVSPNDVFEEVLDAFFEGKRCRRTLAMVNW